MWTPKGFDWVYRKFVSNQVEGYEAIQAKPFENRFLLEQVPDFYERLRGSYDENFYRQEVLGDYLNVRGGLVYHAFDREKNVQADGGGSSAAGDLGAGFQRGSDVFGGGAGGAGGEVSVLDEIVLRRATTEQACEEFEKRFGLPRAGVVVYGDASGASMHTTGYSDYQVIRSYFGSRLAKVSYRVPKANPPVRDRVAMVNAKLRNARGRSAVVRRSEVQGADRRFRAGVVSRKTRRRSIRTKTGGGRIYRMRWGI